MKRISKNKWKAISEISNKYIFLEGAIGYDKKVKEVKQQLLNEYGDDFDYSFQVSKNEIEIIYDTGNYINSYWIKIEKITDKYIWGENDFIKYKIENIIGIII